MGRLDVEIRHGGGGDSGAVIALIVLIVLAIAGGVGHKAVTGALHTLATVVEVIAWTLATVLILATVTGAVYAAFRIRRAVLAARARRAITPQVITLTPDSGYLPPPDTARPAIGSPPVPRAWPLPGWWAEVRPRIGSDDDEHRR
jgi:hypothetical protein